MGILIENSLVKEDDKIFLRNQLPKYLIAEETNPEFEAVITGKKGQSNSIMWSKDGKESLISSLTWAIFKDHQPEGKTHVFINE